MSMKDKICVALDVDNKADAFILTTMLAPYVGVFKVGLELYTAVGPEIIDVIHDKGCKVFLDLKYHDIPTTVAKAATVATRMGVDMFNIHISGGVKMMNETVKAVNDTANKYNIPKPKILGVTVLTSTNQYMLSYELLIPEYIHTYVPHLANLAKQSGLSGIVCSANEVIAIKKLLGDDFYCVTPGIRLLGSNLNDQVRITTPEEAIEHGSDCIVIGRPITHADNPACVAKEILNSLESLYK